MKMLLLFVILNLQTGDLDGFAMGGPVLNVVACKDAGRVMYAELVKKLPPGEIAFPVCLDVSKFDLGHPPYADIPPPISAM